jgi:proline racemase
MHAASPRAAEKGVGYIQAELQLRPISIKICSAISVTNATAFMYSMAASIEIERLHFGSVLSGPY